MVTMQKPKSKDLTSIINYIPKQIVKGGKWALNGTVSFSKWTRDGLVSYSNFFVEQTKKPGWKKDALVTTAAQVALVNWLQMIPPLVAQFSEATVENNWYLMTVFSLLVSYPYAIFRDWRKSKMVEKHPNKKEGLGHRLFYEGLPLGAWHFVESSFRFGYVFGESNLGKLATASSVLTLFGFTVGNIYGASIDLARYIVGINKFDKEKKPYAIEKYDEMSKKYDAVRTGPVMREIPRISYSRPVREGLLYVASLTLLFGSYAVVKSTQRNNSADLTPSHKIELENPLPVFYKPKTCNYIDDFLLE